MFFFIRGNKNGLNICPVDNAGQIKIILAAECKHLSTSLKKKDESRASNKFLSQK